MRHPPKLAGAANQYAAVQVEQSLAQLARYIKRRKAPKASTTSYYYSTLSSTLSSSLSSSFCSGELMKGRLLVSKVAFASSMAAIFFTTQAALCQYPQGGRGSGAQSFVLYQQALEAFQNKDCFNTLKLCNMVLDQDHLNKNALHLKALAYSQMGDKENAIAAFRQALNIDYRFYHAATTSVFSCIKSAKSMTPSKISRNASVSILNIRMRTITLARFSKKRVTRTERSMISRRQCA